MINNLKVQGFILIDVDAVALNNAGKSTQSNFDNAVATKRIFKNGKNYVYVSGQAWRYWWRDTLQKAFNWDLSPITRDSKIAFTAADPIRYADDDIFGYMKAAKDVELDSEGNPQKDKQGKVQTKNVTVTRVSPLKNSVLVSVASVHPSENWSSMARQDGDAVPYSKQEYSAVMKGMFSLDLEQAGTFATYNKTGFKNLTEALKKEALENGASEISDSYLRDEKGNLQKLVRLSPDVRIKRISETVLALKSISGGAMQTSNLGDVTPKFIVLATLNSGNHPFSHIALSKGANEDRADLSVEALKEVLRDYQDNIRGTVFIGRRAGFFDEKENALKSLETEFLQTGDVVDKFNGVRVLTINEAIDQYVEQLKKQL
jgi:CRISPR-associated protein Cst2